MSELKEEIANTIWPLTDWDGDYQNALLAADAILAIPRIADALKAHERPVRKLSLGHSIGTGTRRD